jgi:UDP-N-acetylmuramate-alanine ligase
LDNPEILSAINTSIPLKRRAEKLGELINFKRTSIAVRGTHGKKTTSSTTGMILEKTGCDPTLVVGGFVSNLNTNVKLGSGDLLIAEADEFDRSFLALNPTIASVTNLQMEHTDCYKDFNDIEDAFSQFCKSVPFYGPVILCTDSDSLMRIMPKIKKPITTYGISEGSDYRALNIEYSKNRSKYSLFYKNKDLGEININVPGKHNVLNSLASIALGMEIHVPLDLLKKGINSYSGVRRRFEIKKNKTDIFVVR